MRVIIAGGRDLFNIGAVYEAVEASGFGVSRVLSGGAPGIDKCGEVWAQNEGVPCDVYPADWAKHGRAAGPIRNRQMAENADALIAIPTGGPGTKNMIRIAEKLGLRVYIHDRNGGSL